MSYLTLDAKDPVLLIIREVIERRTPGLFPCDAELVEASCSAVLVTYAMRETYDALTWRLTIDRSSAKPSIRALTAQPRPDLWPPRWEDAKEPVLVDLSDVQPLCSG